MNPNCEKLLDELYVSYQGLINRIKVEQDPAQLKILEADLNKINNVTRALTSYINYYKIKDLKNK